MDIHNGVMGLTTEDGREHTWRERLCCELGNITNSAMHQRSRTTNDLGSYRLGHVSHYSSFRTHSQEEAPLKKGAALGDSPYQWLSNFVLPFPLLKITDDPRCGLNLLIFTVLQRKTEKV